MGMISGIFSAWIDTPRSQRRTWKSGRRKEWHVSYLNSTNDIFSFASFQNRVFNLSRYWISDYKRRNTEIRNRDRMGSSFFISWSYFSDHKHKKAIDFRIRRRGNHHHNIHPLPHQLTFLSFPGHTIITIHHWVSVRIKRIRSPSFQLKDARHRRE